ncbi:C39 family peptidase [Micromonospora sp. DT62]|uniref:C39 family peptidase n=1 Tax=Micromonospora sp. DT62 TaxID=3416521 RepID=UPI003CE881D4
MQPLPCPGHPPPRRTRHRASRPAVLAGLCAAALCAALAGVAPATAGPATVTPVAGPAAAGIHTVRSDAGYQVRIDGVTRATVTVDDPGNSVRTTLSPTGRHAALIRDFNGRYGAELLSLDVGTGRLTRVAAGRITSAVYTPDGRLGYVLAGDSSGQLRLRQPDGGAADRPVASLDGVDVQLIGWGEGAAAALLTHRAVGEPSGPSLTRVNLATGGARTVLAGDAAKGVVYRDIRVTRIDGAQRVSAIVADHVYPCAGTSSSLLLADEHGTAVIRTGATRDSYREAAWSPDGDRVAYTIQACVSPAEKAASRSRALQRLDELNGTYVRDLAATTAQRLVEGVTPNYRLDGFAGAQLRLASERYGIQVVDAARPVTAAVLDATAAPATAVTTATKGAAPKAPAGGHDVGGDVGVQSKIVGSTFIHQLWDTADNFNGNSACGPTSAVMDLAGYQLANQNGYYVSTPSRHWSPYGRYITHSYTAYGTTYDATAPDPNWNYFAGAYGWLVETPSQGTLHRWMGDYLNRHVSYPVAETGNVTWSWIKSKIDANLMVVVSGNFAYGQYGHIGLITGYLDDGRVYVNDPYGAGTDGTWDGKNTVYTLDYIRGWYAWAA